jgi:hypothetical protein
MKLRYLVVVASLFVLSGCGVKYCAREQPYQTAQSIPPIVGAGDLKIPTPPTALRIPESKGGQELSYGYAVPDPKKPGKTEIRCLDHPPEMPPSSEATK